MFGEATASWSVIDLRGFSDRDGIEKIGTDFQKTHPYPILYRLEQEKIASCVLTYRVTRLGTHFALVVVDRRCFSRNNRK